MFERGGESRSSISEAGYVGAVAFSRRATLTPAILAMPKYCKSFADVPDDLSALWIEESAIVIREQCAEILRR